MKLSTTKFIFLLVLVVCFVSTKVLAKHHKHDHDCDHDDDDEDKDWDDEDWEDEDWDDEDWDGKDWDGKDDHWDKGDKWNNDNQWDKDNKNWDKQHDDNWNGNNNWGNGPNGQGLSSGYQPSGSIVAGGSTIWSGSGWPMPTNSYGQPPYPTHATPGVVTATWTQVIPTGNPTNIRSEPQVGNTASNVKTVGVSILLAAVAFVMLVAA